MVDGGDLDGGFGTVVKKDAIIAAAQAKAGIGRLEPLHIACAG
jgi:hypothetical protein